MLSRVLTCFFPAVVFKKANNEDIRMLATITDMTLCVILIRLNTVQFPFLYNLRSTFPPNSVLKLMLMCWFRSDSWIPPPFMQDHSSFFILLKIKRLRYNYAILLNLVAFVQFFLLIFHLPAFINCFFDIIALNLNIRYFPIQNIGYLLYCFQTLPVIKGALK